MEIRVTSRRVTRKTSRVVRVVAKDKDSRVMAIITRIQLGTTPSTIVVWSIKTVATVTITRANIWLCFTML